MYCVPWGMRKMLVWLKEQYNNPEIIITENGFSVRGDNDYDREDRHVNIIYTAICFPVSIHVSYFLNCICFDLLAGTKLKSNFFLAPHHSS